MVLTTGEWIAWSIACLVLGAGNIGFAVLAVEHFQRHRLTRFPVLAFHCAGILGTAGMLLLMVLGVCGVMR